MRARLPNWLLFPSAVLALSGCQLITSLDENQITTGTTGVTSSSTGGSGGMGGATSSSTGSTSSQGGAGGAACMDPATDCPASATACVTPICDGAMCGTENAPKDTGCTDAGGKVCDGNGVCVVCTDAALHCPDPMNECLLPSCAAGACGTTPVDVDTPTSTATQIDGDCKLQVCDGAGSTKLNDDNDPLDDGKTCTIDACTNGVNTPTPAMSGLACADDGGKVCGSGTKAGLCVECLQDADCTGGLVCDEANDNFKCVPATCVDNTKDGFETDVDCGGPDCGDCANGLVCSAATDCISAFCNAGTCAACTGDANCAANEFCDVSNGHCTPDQADGATCGGPGACTSGNCIDGVCCDTACNSGCEACSAGVKGQGLDGVCGPVANASDPDNDCAATASSTCGTTGVCNGSGSCTLYSPTTVCNLQSCVNGVQSNTDFCSGTGSCTDAGTVSCGAYTCDGAGLACLTTCINDTQCASGNFCDATNHCVAKQTNGATCGGASACASGNCTDGVCCDTACGTDCFACNVAGSVGTCSPVAANVTDGGCTGASACNGTGTCLSNLGVACGAGGACLSGNCVDGVCCDTGCGATCQACSAVKKGAGSDGTCGNIATGTDPDAECAGAFACGSGGACQSCSDGAQNGGETDTDCGGPCGGCANGDTCVGNADCLSNLCSGGICLPTGCSNGVKDGLETDIDCGGGVCAPCDPPNACNIGLDCSTSVCTGNACQVASCTDLTKNGPETDVDCGGTCPLDCAVGQACGGNGDCQTGVCTGNVCQAATCFDGVPNGAETDVDCGGPICADCIAGQGCLGPNDCASGVCTGNVCQVANCIDGVKNAGETGIDCGGGLCPTCANGQPCGVNTDCTSLNCASGFCAAAVCGDGVISAGEACDDGNTSNNDGCTSKCKVEAPYSCVGAGPTSCTSPKEINCNDGRDNDGDGVTDCADSDCALGCNATFGPACGAGEALLVYTSTDVPKPIPDNTPAGTTSVINVGGFGIVKRVVLGFTIPHTFDGDLDLSLISPSGVTTDASSDNGSSGVNYTNTVLNSAGGASCATAVTAGTAPFTGCFTPEATFAVYDNSQAKGNWTFKAVDDANTDTGTINAYLLSLCAGPSNCGDGIVDAGETCDDGNVANGDGCTGVCAVESGYACVGTAPSVCVKLCGNSTIDAGETCDDGNAVSNDGCSSTCATENGYVCTGTGPGSCTTVCSDTFKVGAETCDDGNLSSNDGCSGSCLIEPAFCGDGLKNGTDACDDGNTVSGDGCSSTCTWETVAEDDANGTTALADTATTNNPQLLLNGNKNITGSIGVAGDIDIFKMTVASSTVGRFELFDSSGVDCIAFATMRVDVLDSAGVQLKTNAFNGAGIGGCSVLAMPLDPGTYYVRVQRSTSGIQLNYFLQARFVNTQFNESEGNDTQATANTILTNTREFILAGDHSVSTDLDWFRFYVPPGASIRAEVIEGDNSETCESNGIDSTIYLLDPSGTLLGSDGDTGRGFCSYIDGTGTTAANTYANNRATGFYHLRLESFSTSATAGNQFKYKILVTIRNP